MKQLAFKTHGGLRPRAGRKRRVDQGAHKARPALERRHPVHITIRLRDGLPGLRNDRALRHLLAGMKRTQNFGLRVNHFSVLSNHLHMIAEADGIQSVQRGMMSFNRKLAGWLRSQGAKPQHKKRGLFQGRYHLRVITSARQMRNTLRYVLLNASTHFRKCAYMDQFSSAASFGLWPQLLKAQFYGLIEAQFLSLREAMGLSVGHSPPLMDGLSPPATWLGAKGWR